MQKKIVFIGTDLHLPQNESFSKQVHTLISNLRDIDYKVLSLEFEKSLIKESNFVIIKKSRFRKLSQSLSLLYYVTKLRAKGYNNFHLMLVPSTKFHKFLISYLNFIGGNTIITLTKKDPHYLKNCINAKIIINNFSESFRSPNSRFILPPTEFPSLNKADFSKKQNLALSTCPFRKKYLNDRGIISLLRAFKNIKHFKLLLLCRGGEARKEIEKIIKKEKIKNVRTLGNVSIGHYLIRAKVLFNLYAGNSPEIPLSGVEALSHGCYLLSSDNVLSRIAQKNKIGKIIHNEEDIASELEKLKNSKAINQNIYNKSKSLFLGKTFDKFISLYK